MIFLGSPSFTRKYGAAALTSLKGAVLCRAIMVSHCLSVICAIDLQSPSRTLACTKSPATAYLMYHSIPGKTSVVDLSDLSTHLESLAVESFSSQ